MSQTENPVNYGGLPPEFSSFELSKVVIVPVPYDATSTWQKGADKGPAALLDASANMELYDIETGAEVYRIGIFTDLPVEGHAPPEEMAVAVEERVSRHLQAGKFVITIGGEHSVSIGAIKSHARKYADVTILQLDAHTDMRDEYHGSKCNHACVMARAKETCPVVQVGIRSMDSSERDQIDSRNIFFAEDIYENPRWIDKVISRLTDRVYITIDLDVFDPAIMPSTGTPEPGGLLWYEVLELLKKVIASRDVVGFDVVELCPNTINRAPDFLAAKLIYKLLAYKFRG